MQVKPVKARGFQRQDYSGLKKKIARGYAILHLMQFLIQIAQIPHRLYCLPSGGKSACILAREGGVIFYSYIGYTDDDLAQSISIPYTPDLE